MSAFPDVHDAPALAGPDEHAATAELCRRHVTMGPLVLRVLPPFGAEPLSARQVAAMTHSSIDPARKTLASAVRLGLAVAREMQMNRNAAMKLYTRALAIGQDDFESSPNVYPEEQEAEETVE